MADYLITLADLPAVSPIIGSRVVIRCPKQGKGGHALYGFYDSTGQWHKVLHKPIPDVNLSYDPAFRMLTATRQPQGTVRLTPAQADRLVAMLEHSGTVWDEREILHVIYVFLTTPREKTWESSPFTLELAYHLNRSPKAVADQFSATANALGESSGVLPHGTSLVAQVLNRVGLEPELVRERLVSLCSGCATAGSGGLVAPSLAEEESSTSPERRTLVGEVIIRSRLMAELVKDWHAWACQVCGLTLERPNGRFLAEGAHIVPLGRPHNGPDTTSNILCLCPNHHRALDAGALAIRPEDLAVFQILTGSVVKVATLTESELHKISNQALTYHWEKLCPELRALLAGEQRA